MQLDAPEVEDDPKKHRAYHRMDIMTFTICSRSLPWRLPQDYTNPENGGVSLLKKLHKFPVRVHRAGIWLPHRRITLHSSRDTVHNVKFAASWQIKIHIAVALIPDAMTADTVLSDD